MNVKVFMDSRHHFATRVQQLIKIKLSTRMSNTLNCGIVFKI